jgi:hypothetical protein
MKWRRRNSRWERHRRAVRKTWEDGAYEHTLRVIPVDDMLVRGDRCAKGILSDFLGEDA